MSASAPATSRQLIHSHTYRCCISLIRLYPGSLSAERGADTHPIADAGSELKQVSSGPKEDAKEGVLAVQAGENDQREVTGSSQLEELSKTPAYDRRPYMHSLHPSLPPLPH